jgi:hypothetical protein
VTACALLRTATTASDAAASTAVAVAVIATAGAAGLYAVGSFPGPARRTAASHPTAAVATHRSAAHTSAAHTSATHAALARVVGPGLASLPLPEVRARVTAAVDRHVGRVAALAAKVGTSERLSIAQRARATERLAAARAELADLRADVCDQTSGEGLARVLTEAHRHRVFWRNWTLERVEGAPCGAGATAPTAPRTRGASEAATSVRSLARLTAPADPAAPAAPGAA